MTTTTTTPSTLSRHVAFITNLGEIERASTTLIQNSFTTTLEDLAGMIYAWHALGIIFLGQRVLPYLSVHDLDYHESITMQMAKSVRELARESAPEDATFHVPAQAATELLKYASSIRGFISYRIRMRMRSAQYLHHRLTGLGITLDEIVYEQRESLTQGIPAIRPEDTGVSLLEISERHEALIRAINHSVREHRRFLHGEDALFRVPGVTDLIRHASRPHPKDANAEADWCGKPFPYPNDPPSSEDVITESIEE